MCRKVRDIRQCVEASFDQRLEQRPDDDGPGGEAPSAEGFGEMRAGAFN